MLFNKTTLFASAIAFSCSFTPAIAAVRGDVSLRNIQITVQDLAETDLAQSYFNIVNTPSNTVISLSAGDAQSGTQQSDSWQSETWLAPKDLSDSTTGSSASASVGATFLSASGVALRDGGSFSAYPQAPYFGDSEFTLSAHTSVRIRGLASIQLSVDARQAQAGAQYIGTDEVLAAAGLFLYVSPTQQSAPGSYLSQSLSSFQSTHGALSFEDSRWIEVELVNDSATAISGKFYAYASTYGSAALAVPEPSTGALMLVGLAIVGGMALRRQTSPSKPLTPKNN